MLIEVAVLAADSGLRDDPRERTMVFSIGSNYETAEHFWAKFVADDFSSGTQNGDTGNWAGQVRDAVPNPPRPHFLGNAACYKPVPALRYKAEPWTSLRFCP